MHREAAVGGQAYQAVGDVGQTVDAPPLAPGVVGQALNLCSGFVADGGDGAELVVVEVAQAGGLVGADGGVAYRQVAGAGDLQGKDHAAGAEVVLVFGDAVGFDLFLVAQALAVFAVEVPGGAGAALQGGGGVGGELHALLDALVLGAIDKGERAVCGGAGGVVDVQQVAVPDLGGHVKAGVLFPAHVVAVLGGVAADAVPQVAVAQRGGAVAGDLGAGLVVVKGVGQYPGAGQGLASGGVLRVMLVRRLGRWPSYQYWPTSLLYWMLPRAS